MQASIISLYITVLSICQVFFFPIHGVWCCPGTNCLQMPRDDYISWCPRLRGTIWYFFYTQPNPEGIFLRWLISICWMCRMGVDRLWWDLHVDGRRIKVSPFVWSLLWVRCWWMERDGQANLSRAESTECPLLMSHLKNNYMTKKVLQIPSPVFSPSQNA